MGNSPAPQPSGLEASIGKREGLIQPHPNLSQADLALHVNREVHELNLKDAVGRHAEKLIEVLDAMKADGSRFGPTHGFLTPRGEAMLNNMDLTPAQMRAFKLFNNFYVELSRCFPKDERESARQYLEYFSDKEDPLKIKLFTNVDPKSKDLPSRIFGGIHYQNLTTESGVKFVVAENAWAPPEAQAQGYGLTIVRAGLRAARESGSELIFAEMNDAAIMTRDEITFDTAISKIDPVKRGRVWGMNRFRMLNAGYIQPALDDESKPVFYLCAMIRFPEGSPHVHQDKNGSYISKDLYLEILRKAHDYDLQGPDAVAQTDIYKKILATLEGTDRIYLKTLTTNNKPTDRTRCQEREDLKAA